MGRSFRALERSLAITERRAAKSKRDERFRQANTAEGMFAPIPSQLQEQIDIIRGRHVAQPTRSLRTLEDRILGRTPSARQRYETLRLDQGQVAHPSTQNQTIIPQTLAGSIAVSEWRNQSLYGSPPMTTVAYPYAPEFSAPDTSRFHVESFSDTPTSSEDILRPEAVVVSNASSADFADDSTDWLSQAESEQPKKITAASKNNLNSSMALAKDDFERDLASILGQPVAPAVATPDTLFNATQTSVPDISEKPVLPDPNTTPHHPSHDVFDQMGLAMRYANSFDLGNVNLHDRFNRLERDLEQSVTASASAAPAAVSNPFVDPMSLSEFDLMAELAEIGSGRPVSQKSTTNNQHNLTEKIAGENHD